MTKQSDIELAQKLDALADKNRTAPRDNYGEQFWSDADISLMREAATALRNHGCTTGPKTAPRHAGSERSFIPDGGGALERVHRTMEFTQALVANDQAFSALVCSELREALVSGQNVLVIIRHADGDPRSMTVAR